MNSKKLAEMIKSLRKSKMEQIEPYKGSGADIQDPASPNRPPGSKSKEIHHGIVKEDDLNEFQTRAPATHNYVGSKVETGREPFRKAVSRPLGSNQSNRYRLGEKKELSINSKKTLINTTPEQDSAMIGTQ